MGRYVSWVSRWADLVSGSMEAGLESGFTGVDLMLESMGMGLGPGFVWEDLYPGSLGVEGGPMLGWPKSLGLQKLTCMLGSGRLSESWVCRSQPRG